MDILHMFARFMQEGGFFMYPILLVLALGLAIAVERFIYLNNTKKSNVRVWNQLLPLIETGKYREAITAAADSNAAVGKILAYGLSRLSAARSRDDIETAMEEGLMEQIPRLEKRTHYLATFANISTLLGLLGTVTGLIDAFAAVANADPAQKAELLSASISVELHCTAIGIGAALPGMLVSFFLSSVTNYQFSSLELYIPPASTGAANEMAPLELEVIIRHDALEVNNRNGGLIRRIDKQGGAYDYKALGEVLKGLKADYPQKLDAAVLSEADIPYDVLVKTMDAVRSYPIAGGIKVSYAELFPELSIVDAPHAAAAKALP